MNKRFQAVLVTAAAVGWGVACGSGTSASMEIDCEGPLEQYEFSPPFMDFETGTPPWFGYGDCTPGSTFGDATPLCYPEVPEPAPTDVAVAMPIENGGRCGSVQALELRLRGHRDWGAGFGEYQLSTSGIDGSDYEGLALWARSPGNSTRIFSFTVGDGQTRVEGGSCDECIDASDCDNQRCIDDPAFPGRDVCDDCLTQVFTPDDPNHCRLPNGTGCGIACPGDQRSCVAGFCERVECRNDGDCNAGTPFCIDGVCSECEDDDDCTGEDAEGCGTGICGPLHSCLFEDGTDDDDVCGEIEVCSGIGPLDCTNGVDDGFLGDASGNPAIVLPGDTCGNDFRTTLTTSNTWQLYLFPFSSMSQDPLPSRSPQGIDASDIRGLTIIVPKEAVVDLWLDDIGFYRRRGAGSD